jgi:hypothetical protein
MAEELYIRGVALGPYAQRTRILLHLKGIQLELVKLDWLKPRTSSFVETNPAGRVPALAKTASRAMNPVLSTSISRTSPCERLPISVAVHGFPLVRWLHKRFALQGVESEAPSV